MRRLHAESSHRVWLVLGTLLLALLLLGTSAAPLDGQRGALRFRSVSIADPLMNNEEAFRLLVPVDWRVTGGIDWHPELATLAFTRLLLTDPRSPTALEGLPQHPLHLERARPPRRHPGRALSRHVRRAAGGRGSLRPGDAAAVRPRGGAATDPGARGAARHGAPARHPAAGTRHRQAD